MNDHDHNILDIWLSGEGTVRATNAVSDPEKKRHADARRLSIIVSGSIDTNSHPWAKAFKKIDVTLYFSDEIPVDDGCAFLSASEICLEGNVAYRDLLDIEAFLPTASFTMVSQILTSSRSGRPMLFLLTDGDIAAWAEQDEPELLKAQECAFDYDAQTLAAIDEQAHEEVTEQARVDTTPRRRRWRQKQNVEAAANRGGYYFWCSDFRNGYLIVSRTDFDRRLRAIILTTKLKDLEQRKAQLKWVARIDKVTVNAIAGWHFCALQASN